MLMIFLYMCSTYMYMHIVINVFIFYVILYLYGHISLLSLTQICITKYFVQHVGRALITHQHVGRAFITHQHMGRRYHNRLASNLPKGDFFQFCYEPLFQKILWFPQVIDILSNQRPSISYHIHMLLDVRPLVLSIIVFNTTLETFQLCMVYSVFFVEYNYLQKKIIVIHYYCICSHCRQSAEVHSVDWKMQPLYFPGEAMLPSTCKVDATENCCDQHGEFSH